MPLCDWDKKWLSAKQDVIQLNQKLLIDSISLCAKRQFFTFQTSRQRVANFSSTVLSSRSKYCECFIGEGFSVRIGVVEGSNIMI